MPRVTGQIKEPPPPGPWAIDAACVGTETALWFPEPGAGISAEPVNRIARDICRSCPVLDDCADYIARHPQPGTWAAMTERDRRQRRAK